jgi:hypothetical protein
MQVAEGLGWLRPHVTVLAETYGTLRAAMEPIPAFEQTLSHVLDDDGYDRIQSFFDGEHDAVYGLGAGERARTQLRDALEATRQTRPPGGSTEGTPLAASGSSSIGRRQSAERAANERRNSTEGEVTDIDRFYDEDPVRRGSEEIPFGDRWSLGSPAVTWDVFWVVETGELVGYRCADASNPTVGAVLDRTFPEGTPPAVEVLEVEPSLDRVRSMLGGWEAEQGKRNSYTWLRSRLGLP